MSTLPLPPGVSSERGRASLRAVSGRQTLGSNHDGQQPQVAAHEMADGGLRRVASERPVWWHVFKERCTALEADSRRTVERLIQHLERGWVHVSELQLACGRQRTTSQRG